MLLLVTVVVLLLLTAADHADSLYCGHRDEQDLQELDMFMAS